MQSTRILKRRTRETTDLSQLRPSFPEFTIFLLGLALVTYLGASAAVWAGPERGVLVDTDGYMRFLRIEELASGGDWFNPVFERSNHPFGETQHWTRPLDVYVLGFASLLAPIADDDSLYWAAVFNAPLLLAVLGWMMYRVFPFPRSLRFVAMLMLLGLIPVTSYATAGRVDHHMAILVLFVGCLSALLRGLSSTAPRIWPLATSLALGMWVSTEFLVPFLLVGLTLGATACWRGKAGSARFGARVYGLTTALLAVALVVERGVGSFWVEYDRLSIVHVVLSLGATGLLTAVGAMAGPGRARNFLVTAGASGLVAVPVLVAFPGLIGGPFVDVDPRVKDLWLYSVNELQPAWSLGGSVRWYLLAPLAVGLGAGVWSLLRRRENPTWVRVVTSWLLAYTGLTLLQARWALFGQVLAIPLVLHAIQPWFVGLGDRSSARILRPVVIVLLIFGIQLGGLALGSEAPRADAAECDLEDVTAFLQGQGATTVLASQDVGPEILYRTDHRVIATPYHRNESGLLYAHDLMGMPIDGQAAIDTRLRERDVGLILVCPGKADLLQPSESEGSFYEALVMGRPPKFIRQVKLPSGTDYLLFAVEG